MGDVTTLAHIEWAKNEMMPLNKAARILNLSGNWVRARVGEHHMEIFMVSGRWFLLRSEVASLVEKLAALKELARL